MILKNQKNISVKNSKVLKNKRSVYSLIKNAELVRARHYPFGFVFYGKGASSTLTIFPLFISARCTPMSKSFPPSYWRVSEVWNSTMTLPPDPKNSVFRTTALGIFFTTCSALVTWNSRIPVIETRNSTMTRTTLLRITLSLSMSV